MAMQPSEEQGDSIQAESPAGSIQAESPAGICSSSNREKIWYNRWGPKYAGTRIFSWFFLFTLSPDEHNADLGKTKGGKKYVKDLVLTLSPTDEIVLASVGSASSQSEGSSENFKEEVDEHYYGLLLRAAFRGDWEFAKRFFEQDAASKTAKITSRSETVLHVAALSGHDKFLENLVVLLSPYPEALEMVDCHGRTALHNAVKCGRISMVKALVRSNPILTQIADNKGRVPLTISAREASMHEEIAWFLAKITTDDGPSHPFSNPSVIDTIIDLILNGCHGVILYLVGRYPHLITMRRGEYANHLKILDVLARNESHFPSGTRLSVLEALIYKCIPVVLNYEPTNENSDPGFLCKLIGALQCLTRSLWNAAKIIVPIIKRIHEVKLRHMAAIELAKQVCNAISLEKTTEIIDSSQMKDSLNEATTRGITEIVELCIQFFPHLIWIWPHSERLETEAMKFRQERTLSLFLKVSSTNKLSLVQAPTQAESMKMMTAVAECAAAESYPNFDAVSNKAGAAFQMQRELQWYKAVESWVVPYVAFGYFDEKTYWNKFVESHKELTEKGEKWVKGTANSCMLVSTLIATVLFAIAFTVSGGNDNKIGVPLLSGQDSFYIFAISDALGLFFSVLAILLFLAILTLRYEVQDFLHLLPKKIIMGLSLLFLSLAFMLVAFAATLAMVIDKRLEWTFIPVALLASVPVALFAVRQLPLLFQMVKSTYGPSIFRPEGIWVGVK